MRAPQISQLLSLFSVSFMLSLCYNPPEMWHESPLMTLNYMSPLSPYKYDIYPWNCTSDTSDVNVSSLTAPDCTHCETELSTGLVRHIFSDVNFDASDFTKSECYEYLCLTGFCPLNQSYKKTVSFSSSHIFRVVFTNCLEFGQSADAGILILSQRSATKHKFYTPTPPTDLKVLALIFKSLRGGTP